MKTRATKKFCRGYSLVEMTVAMGIIMAGIAAAAALTLTTAQMEDISYKKGRALAIEEGAARLWQLGLTPTTIRTLLLGDPALVSVTINGDAGDPATVVPSARGSAVTDPAADLGVFEQGTVRATVRTRVAAGSGGPAEVTEALDPVIVVR
jgi:hypothetical protein